MSPRHCLKKELQHAQKSLTSALISEGHMPEPSPADQNTDAEAEASSFPGRSSKTGLLLMGTDGTLS